MASLISSRSNLPRAVVAVFAPLPSILFYLSFLRGYAAGESASFSPLWTWCYHHPLLLANILFFLNVNFLFWIVGLLQDSHWMIDLYWTVIPVLLVQYLANHPLSETNSWRSRLVVVLTVIWSARLNHSYFRREKWQWGAREDWRFSDMRIQYGQNWWWVSFFAIYLAQQFLLMGNCIPLYTVHSKDKQLNLWDIFAALVCLTGVTIASFADTQLHDFTTTNEALKRSGQPLVPILDKGLWHHSRHPNYFGEQLWWWGLAIFAWNLDGGSRAFMGALINTLCLAYVTILVEDRMLKKDYRAAAYKHYQKTTSMWIPWFETSVVTKDKQT